MSPPAPSSGPVPRPSDVAPLEPVSLRALLGEVRSLDPDARIEGDGEALLDDVTHVGGEAGSGVLYAARLGARVDGHDFAGEAVQRGAPALLVQRALDLPVPQLVTGDVAAVLGAVAARVHGHPSRSLCLVGVTGTNGKTTTAHLLEAALAGDGAPTGLLGTVHTRIAGQQVPGVRTTPEATDLQRLLRVMRERGVTAAAMEVSSHGLALRRVDGTRFRAAAFTNLSQDHLDFHRDMEEYEAAKRRLFTPTFTDRAAVDVDSAAGRRMAAAARDAGLRVATVSTAPGVPTAGEAWEAGEGADLAVTDVRLRPDGSTFRAALSGQLGPDHLDVRVALPGPFNVANAALALATAVLAGVPAGEAAAGLEALRAVPGRLERVDAGQRFTVLVDYAHTPEAVQTVLAAVRQATPGRVLVVLGCGGDRDPGKRPLMGRAAADGADVAVLTSDNPRSEEPRAIIDAMQAGAEAVPQARVVVEVDRARAIALALHEARRGDTVLIAGKGHETYQEVDGRRLDFDDRVVARTVLEEGAAG